MADKKEFDLPVNCNQKVVGEGAKAKTYCRVNGQWVDEAGKAEPVPKPKKK